MSWEQEAAFVYGGSGDASAPFLPDRLAGTGTTEDHNTTALKVGAMATLLCGDTAVRFSLRTDTGGSTQVATTDRILAANQRFDWIVTKDTAVVYVEASDGSSAYECWVWSSSSGAR